MEESEMNGNKKLTNGYAVFEKKLTIENENGEFCFFLLKIAFKLFNIFLRVLMFLNVILNADNRSR